MIVEMKKLVLIGHRADRFNLFRALHKSRIVEIISTRDIENTARLDNTPTFEKINENLSRLNFAFDFIKQQKKTAERLAKITEKTDNPYDYKAPKKNPLASPIVRMDYDRFSEIVVREVELLNHVSELENTAASMNEADARIVRLESDIEQYSLYSDVSLPFSAFCDTEKTVAYLGFVPLQRAEELKAFSAGAEWAEFEFYSAGKVAPFAVVALKENAEELSTALQGFDFVRNGFGDDMTAAECIERAQKEIARINESKIDLVTEAVAKEQFLQDLRTLYDYNLVEQQKFTALDGFAATKRSFVLEAWYPAEQEERLKRILDETSDAFVYEFNEPSEHEIVPTLVRSKRLVEPYEDITNMYSVPNYRGDIDPTPVMAFFYFLFFGMMLADAGYGLLLAVGGFLLYKIRRPVKGKGRLILIITMGGISTVIWGALFGGWFGIEGTENTFLGQLQWFKPMDDPILMLGISFGLGILHIMTGMLLNAINLIRKRRALDALCEVGTWYAIIIGLALTVVDMMFVKSGVMKYVGIALIGVGVLGLILSGMRGKKGKKKLLGLFGGVAKLYDGVNLVSDLLSYARLFGLGLAGGVIALVINMMCGVIIDVIPPVGGVPVIGIIICIPIYAIGHLFNLGISTLGAYVHNCRLQYIEFFGKFYEGTGHQFIPFGSKTKYTYIDM